MKRGFTVGLVILGGMGCATTPGASIMVSPHHHWLAVGYDAERPDSILKTQRAATDHCRTWGASGCS